MNAKFQYNRDLFIFGNPLDIPNVGRVRFLNYMEYLDQIENLSLINMDVLHIYYQYKKLLDKNPESKEILEDLKKENLFNIVRSQREFSDAYITVLSIVLDENDEKSGWSDHVIEALNKDRTKHEEIHKESDTVPEFDGTLLMKALELIFTHEELFMSMRRLILDMQMLVEEKVSSNPEIQKGIEISRELKSEKNEGITPTDVVTSIVAGTSNSFEDVRGMTAIQIQSIFQRIGAFKNYDTSTLFATVSSDVKIESWSKKINLYEKEEYAIEKKDFDKMYGGLFK